MDHHVNLSRRERQIMDVIYGRGEASVNQIREQLPDPPTHTAVRTLLRILEAKGHVSRVKRGRELIYSPVRARRTAGRTALQRVIDTFFDGSLEQAISAHVVDGGSQLTDDELERIVELIRKSRKQGD